MHVHIHILKALYVHVSLCVTWTEFIIKQDILWKQLHVSVVLCKVGGLYISPIKGTCCCTQMLFVHVLVFKLKQIHRGFSTTVCLWYLWCAARFS